MGDTGPNLGVPRGGQGPLLTWEVARQASEPWLSMGPCLDWENGLELGGWPCGITPLQGRCGGTAHWGAQDSVPLSEWTRWASLSSS